MSLIFADPFADFQRFFDEAVAQRSGGTPRNTDEQSLTKALLRPKLDVHEGKDSITATLELPGVKKEDVHISLDGGRLTVSGETKSEQETTSEGGHIVRERRFGSFSRSLPVPQGLKSEDIKAKLEDGVLRVTYPKVQAPTAQRIAVE